MQARHANSEVATVSCYTRQGPRFPDLIVGRQSACQGRRLGLQRTAAYEQARLMAVAVIAGVTDMQPLKGPGVDTATVIVAVVVAVA